MNQPLAGVHPTPIVRCHHIAAAWLMVPSFSFNRQREARKMRRRFVLQQMFYLSNFVILVKNITPFIFCVFWEFICCVCAFFSVTTSLMRENTFTNFTRSQYLAVLKYFIDKNSINFYLDSFVQKLVRSIVSYSKNSTMYLLQ